MVIEAQNLNSCRRALTPWELPKLLAPMHQWHKTSKRPTKERAHFLPMLAFTYRNRYVLATQLQRRFSGSMPSDRTARRHLTELESLGYLTTAEARGTSPLWPKVYRVTARGIHRLRQGLQQRREQGTMTRVDRRRGEGSAAEHVLHEILTTEFLLQVWLTASVRPDLELLTIQRRSLEKHQAFIVGESERESRLKPDGMFLYRQQERGMMCCFLELDNGTESLTQLRMKFRRYEAWAGLATAQAYLCDLYRRYGAQQPQPVFRLLLVARDRIGKDDERRLLKIQTAAKVLSASMRRRCWFATAQSFRDYDGHATVLNQSIWRQGDDPDVRTTIFS